MLDGRGNPMAPLMVVAPAPNAGNNNVLLHNLYCGLARFSLDKTIGYQLTHHGIDPSGYKPATEQIYFKNGSNNEIP